jgi:hypothetical protein
MTKGLTALSTSLDGFIAGADDSREQPLCVDGEALFRWRWLHPDGIHRRDREIARGADVKVNAPSSEGW